jgi:hypothetical protein
MVFERCVFLSRCFSSTLEADFWVLGEQAKLPRSKSVGLEDVGLSYEWFVENTAEQGVYSITFVFPSLPLSSPPLSTDLFF